MVSYELGVYYKQGDDLHYFLQLSPDPATALKAWAKSLRDGADKIERVAAAIADLPVVVSADTHCIELQPRNERAEDAMDELAAEGVLIACEYEGEET